MRFGSTAFATERVERPLAAILAADVVGYSRLIGVNEEGTLERLKALPKKPNKLSAVGSNERKGSASTCWIRRADEARLRKGPARRKREKEKLSGSAAELC